MSRPEPRVRLHHTHLFAADLDVSLEFYRRWFGAEILADRVLAGSRNVMVGLGDGRLNFYQQPPRGTGPSAVHHLGLQVDGLAALVQTMTDGGVAFRSAIRVFDDLAYIMVEAPDGVLLELFEWNQTEAGNADGRGHGGMAPTDRIADWFAW